METWFWVLGWVLYVLTITGNGFIISLVGRNRPLRTKTNAFIASLAVADFLVGVGVVPSLFFCEISGGGCKWSRAWSTWLPSLIRWLFGYASAFNLCSLVTDRYIAIVKPLKYVTCVTPRRLIQMIFLSWAIPFGFVTTTFSLFCLGLNTRVLSMLWRCSLRSRHVVSLFSATAQWYLLYTAISRKVVAKIVHATIPKGNMGYDQYTCSWHCSCRTYFCCFPLALANILPWPLVPFFEI